MAIKTEVIGLDRLRAKGRSLESDVHGEVVKEIRKEVTGFEAEMHVRAAAFGRIGRRAARTLGVGIYTNGASIHGGGGQGLAATLFWGAEFGGQKRRKTYLGTSKHGKRYLIKRRRTTMMFQIHLGTRGYFYLPTLREDLRGINGRIEDAIGRGLAK
jgi:hypothetical protein